MTQWVKARIAPDVHEAMKAEWLETTGWPVAEVGVWMSLPVEVDETLPLDAIIYQKADGTEVRSTWSAALEARRRKEEAACTR